MRRTAFLSATLGATLLLATVGAASVARSQSSSGTAAATQVSSSDTANSNRFDEYHLGAGDKVRINVYGEEDLSGEFLVSGEGKVSMPLIGEVQAAGLSVNAFQEEVRLALGHDYLKNPKVSVEVLNYRPYYILGEVAKPGEYPYTNGLTVFNAVATAGGFTYRAAQGRVYVRAKTDTREHAVPLNGTTVVSPGDTIRIGERIF